MLKIYERVWMHLPDFFIKVLVLQRSGNKSSWITDHQLLDIDLLHLSSVADLYFWETLLYVYILDHHINSSIDLALTMPLLPVYVGSSMYILIDLRALRLLMVFLPRILSESYYPFTLSKCSLDLYLIYICCCKCNSDTLLYLALYDIH